MKKLFLIFCILGICKTASAQWTTSGSDIYNSNAGNVGIGTNSPLDKLNVNGPAFFQGTTAGVRIGADNSGAYGFISTYDQNLGSAKNLVLQTGGGNVGIGTTSPNVKLHVVGTANTYTSRFVGSGTTGYSYGTYIQAGTNSSDYAFVVANATDAVTYLSVRGDGNIGIGTTSPLEKLSVNGKIRAKEVKVETGWSDFVFEPVYKLPDLKETEQYIKANNHLPEIPSAKEVAENGINLGEMNAKLLQKIEELTLYLIQQDKKQETLINEVEQLKSKINQPKP